MTKRVMHQLNLKRIAAVDRPCQEAALGYITKRDMAGAYLAKGKDDAALPEGVEAYLKRDFSGDKRKELAATGAALPDGSFPIVTRGDIKNALQALGRAKDPAKAKAHITARARALDATSLLPDKWKAKSLVLLGDVTNDEAMEGFGDAVEVFLNEMGTVDFDSVQAEHEAREYANALLCEIDEACCSLRTVFDEIGEDDAITDKQKALQESLDQFKAHIQGIIPEGVENAMVAVALTEAGFEITDGGAVTKQENDMGFSIETKKSLGLPVTANDADVTKALEVQKAQAEFGANVLKMSPAHSAFMANEKAKMPKGGKEAFAAMSADDRAAHMKDNPVAKAAGEDGDDVDGKKKAAEIAADKAAKAAAELAKGADETLTVDGTVIVKSVVGDAQFAMFKSMNAKLEKAADEQAVAVIAKRAAVEMPKISKSADELGTLLHGIAKVAPALATEVETILKAASAQIAKGALFVEVGKSGTGGSGDAAAQIETLAKAAVTNGTYKSIFKARDGVRTANPDLAKQEESERKAAQNQKAA